MRVLFAAIATVLVAGAASAKDTGQPSHQPSQGPMGFGELSLGWMSTDFSTDSLLAVSGGGYLNLPLAQQWNLEVEGRAYSANGTLGTNASDAGIFGHFYWREPEHFALGGFAGYTRLGLYGAQHGDMFTGGAEAQAYWGDVTVYGQAAAFTSSAADTGWLYFNGYFVRGAARYFPTPNLRLQFDAQWATLDNTDHTNALSLVGTAEYRFSQWPLSGFASVRWDQMTPVVNRAGNNTTIMFGIRGYFGSDTLIGNDRNGAPMDVLPFPALFALNFG